MEKEKEALTPCPLELAVKTRKETGALPASCHRQIRLWWKTSEKARNQEVFHKTFSVILRV
jgi:hypothetical protein